ncbi:hypothetical protein ACQCT5_03070 [Sutcliffiella halmapala]
MNMDKGKKSISIETIYMTECILAKVDVVLFCVAIIYIFINIIVNS